jgi:CBS domain containing-hemolysin-like protein
MLWVLLLLIKCVASDDPLIEPLPWSQFCLFSAGSLFLVLFAGCMSGLTVGLMSIDELELEMKLTNGTDIEKKQARKVFDILSNHHLLLVTLLVANAAAMETLPIFLDYMFSTVLAVILSVTFVLFFGEVIPQALCTGPNQLTIASKLVPVVKLVMLIFLPVSWPIAALLDKLFGKHQPITRFGKDELKTLVSLHTCERTGLDPSQIKIIHGAIDFMGERVEKYMISYDKVFALSNNTILTEEVLDLILDKGYSRIPIYKGNYSHAVVGVMLVKSLIKAPRNIPIDDLHLTLREPVFIDVSLSLNYVLSMFQEGKSHMAFVVNQPVLHDMNDSFLTPGDYPRILGIITLEDVLERLLNQDIMDEKDFDLASSMSCNLKSKTLGYKTNRVQYRLSKKLVASKPFMLTIKETGDYVKLKEVPIN